MDMKSQEYQLKSSYISKDIPYFYIMLSALSWFCFAPSRKKCAKVWATYKAGGISLCWHRATQVFGDRRLSYNYLRYQLSNVQSRHLLTSCSNQPLISIVVPVYRVKGKWLKKCIKSVCDQHYQNWELVLVDDASEKEELNRIMNTWASRDKRIRSFFFGE